MKQFPLLFVSLALFMSVRSAAASVYSVSPSTPSNIVAGQPFLITWTGDGTCPDCAIGVYLVFDNSSPMSKFENFTLVGKGTGGTIAFIVPVEFLNNAAVKVMIKGTGVVDSLGRPYPQTQSFNVARNPYYANFNTSSPGNWWSTTTGLTDTLQWWAPTTSHPGDLITLAFDQNAPLQFQVSVAVPAGQSSGLIPLISTTPGYPMRWRYISNGAIQYQSHAIIVNASTGAPPPPPPVTCTVRVTSGCVQPQCVVTGTVVSCP